jgi:hypothetical protein
MGMGPVLATRKALARAGLRVTDLNVVEVNEAFGSQAVACLRELEIDRDRVNLDGGGISIGHPLGATGAASRRKQHRFSGSRVSDTPSPPSASAGARASQQSSKRSRSTRAKPTGGSISAWTRQSQQLVAQAGCARRAHLGLEFRLSPLP